MNDLFEDVEEIEEVNNLLTWWNRYVLPFLLTLSNLPMPTLQPDFPCLFVSATACLQEQCFGQD